MAIVFLDDGEWVGSESGGESSSNESQSRESVQIVVICRKDSLRQLVIQRVI